MAANAPSRVLNVGIIGIGVGGAEILPALESLPNDVKIVAGADIEPRVCAAFGERYPGTHVYDSAEKLCADPDVDAVWISTPNRFHAPHTILACNAGKHVVVEKPMAISLDEGKAMVEAAEKNGVKLLAGHTQSFSTPIRAMRKVIQSGEVGDVRAINIWAYSDWLLRPRTSDELDPTQGGGIPYRQGPHQIDTIRLLGGGLVKSVRAVTGQWSKVRPIVGYYSALFEFENGASANIVHDGYGYFLANELMPWGNDTHRYTAEERVAVRKSLYDGTRNEYEDKNDLRIGGRAEEQVFRSQRPKEWLPGDLGVVVVSCEQGDIRHSAYGIQVYSNEGRRDINLNEVQGVVGRRAEILELVHSINNNTPVYHDGRWGLATLECCMALLESGREHREIQLQHQIPVHDDYDADFRLPS
jgi:phthalate 4,5-cis-dihydrodiol dehydrogenase